jgi:hypothetical protein
VRVLTQERLQFGRWLRTHLLTADLRRARVRADYVSPPVVAGGGLLRNWVTARAPGNGRDTVAAFNGDFFDITGTNSPLGPGVREGRVVQARTGGPGRAVGFGPGELARILHVLFTGHVTSPSGRYEISGLNTATVPAGGLGLYDARWGPSDRAALVRGGGEVAEVVVRRGRVVSVSPRAGAGPVAAGTSVLLARGRSARAVRGWRPGTRVSLAYRARAGRGALPRTVVGGREALVVDGKARSFEGQGNNGRAARTAIGFPREGAELRVMVVEGRQGSNGGVTLSELARLMRDAGAYTALNLDGGGSSTLLARPPGEHRPLLANAPSDGVERPVANGIALTVPRGSRTLRRLAVQPQVSAARAPGLDPVPGGHPERVFPGLHRRLRAVGSDENHGPAAADPRWGTSAHRTGTVDECGMFTARATGQVTVHARHRRVEGRLRMHVLDELTRVVPTLRRVALADTGDSVLLGVAGVDAHGTSAPVEPADVRYGFDPSLVSVAPEGGMLRAPYPPGTPPAWTGPGQPPPTWTPPAAPRSPPARPAPGSAPPSTPPHAP